MSTIVFIDANIPMYLVGANDRYRADARRLVERAVEARERLVTNAEVLQEILHRYTAINQREAIQPAFDAIPASSTKCFPSRSMTSSAPRASCRAGANTVPAMPFTSPRWNAIASPHIMTFDKGFDSYPGVTRVNV